jgi:hypothetical protein
MDLLIPDGEQILSRYESKRKARGFEFTPPAEKAALGRFAFPADVFLTIFLGVITGVLTQATAYLLSLPFRKKESGPESRISPPSDMGSIIMEMKKSTTILQDAIDKLGEQGVNAADANVAVELLLESLQEVTTELAAKKKC